MSERKDSTLGRYEKLLNVKGYSENSIKVYMYYIREFVNSTDKAALHLTIKDAECYIMNHTFSSKSKQNQVYSTIKLFYKYILSVDLGGKIFLERPRKQKKLPYIMDREEVIRRLNSIENKKHKAILYLAYSCGLRRSEIVNLKLADFNKGSKTIYIKNAKGNKDRVVALSDNARKVLVEYYREHRPIGYLFNGQTKERYSASSCDNIMKKYFGRERHIHEMRHFYASHCLDAGIDSRTLQTTLGHNSPKTLSIYAHVSPKLIKQAVAI